jgi:hypothetical protein
MKIEPKSPTGQLPMNFPYAFGAKFSKISMVENYIKRYFRYLVVSPQNGGTIYAPIRHIWGVEKILLKMINYPQM